MCSTHLPLYKTVTLLYNITCRRDMAQFGSALPWGGRGREFKSPYSDHFWNDKTLYEDRGSFLLFLKTNCQAKCNTFEK